MPNDPELPSGDEQQKQPGETVGPDQFYGMDEPGPDHNRHADFFAPQGGGESTEAVKPQTSEAEESVGEAAVGAEVSEPIQIPVTEVSGDDSSGLIEGKEKAHEMALAGDGHRSRATGHRRAARNPFHGGIGTEGEFFHLGRAEIEDRSASEIEGKAGQQYDAEHKQTKDDPTATQPLPPPGVESIPESVITDKSKAEEMAYAGTRSRELAANNRADAPLWDISGQPEMAKNTIEMAKRNDKRADAQEEDAGIEHDLEHGTASRETLLAHQEELFQTVQVLSENLRDTLSELRDTRKKLSNSDDPNKPEATQPETTEPLGQSKDDWEAQQQNTWSN